VELSDELVLDARLTSEVAERSIAGQIPASQSNACACASPRGGHDVPADKIVSCFPRTTANLQAAVREISHVLVFDNSDLSQPFQRVAVFEDGELVSALSAAALPAWLESVLKG